MKLYLAFLSSALILVTLACQASDFSLYEDPNAPKSSTVVPAQLLAGPQATRTPEPTATLDYRATLAVAQTAVENEKQAALDAQQDAIYAQQTAVEANVIIIGYTAQSENNQVVIAQLTQQAFAVAEMHIRETLTAQPTADASRATEQAFIIIQNNERNAQRTQEAYEPTHIAAIANAENAAKYGWVNYAAVALVSLAFCFLVVFVRIYFIRPTERTVQTKAPTIYNKDTTNGGYKLKRIQTVVPCTNEQLMLLAKGIVEHGMTLAVNKWQGTIAHKSIDDLREFMTTNEFARELKSKNGELYVLEAGEDWLADCIALGEPPVPYTCATPSPEVNNAPIPAPVA